jgi:nitrate reductase NapE component
MKDFDKEFKRAGRLMGIVFLLNVIITVAVLGGIGWLVYVLLNHFGIVG